jgi:hypothetical protein
MRRIVPVLLLAAAAFAQNPPKKTDEALRARVSEFYHYHVTEEYRKAEKLVAPEAQDMFYVREKPKYQSFEISKIEYSDRFQKAKVTVTVSKYGHGEGFEGLALKTPSLSSWKLVKGKWCWYVDPEELKRVGFGPSANAGTKPLPGTAVPEMKIDPSAVASVFGHVAVDKSSLLVKPGGSDELTITNNSMGTVTVEVQQVLPDIKVTLDKKQLNRGEKAVATVTYGDNPHSGEIRFVIGPTNEFISVETRRR